MHAYPEIEAQGSQVEEEGEQAKPVDLDLAPVADELARLLTQGLLPLGQHAPLHVRRIVGWGFVLSGARSCSLVWVLQRVCTCHFSSVMSHLRHPCCEDQCKLCIK